MKRPVCIYVDNSNIYLGGQVAANGRNEPKHDMRIDFNNFVKLITWGNNQFDEMVWGGSGPKEIEHLFDGLKEKGADLQIIPRSDSGENETVDIAIQLSMHRHTRKYKETPGTIVLCTGDGKGYSQEKGFLYDVAEFSKEGWKLILFSWECVCHHDLKKFAQAHGKYYQLEKFYESITFIEGGRNATELKLPGDL